MPPEDQSMVPRRPDGLAGRRMRLQERLDATESAPPIGTGFRAFRATYLVSIAGYFLIVGVNPSSGFEVTILVTLVAVAVGVLGFVANLYRRARQERVRIEAELAELDSTLQMPKGGESVS